MRIKHKNRDEINAPKKTFQIVISNADCHHDKMIRKEGFSNLVMQYH